VLGRVLATFDDLDKEAEAVADQEWDRLMSLPGCEDGPDPGELAEQATERGLEYYQTLQGIRQGLLNVAAVWLYHLYEQQWHFFHRKEVLYPAEERCKELDKWRVFKNRLAEARVYVEKLPSWTKVDELRLAANTVKHGEGPSAEDLRNLRPDLFVPPWERDGTEGDSLWAFPLPPEMPLAGEDMYVSAGDLGQYFSALLSFWREFGEAIRDK